MIKMKKCESCGMPLEENTTSKRDQRYCIYCQDQQTGELKSREEVRAGREEAEKMADGLMPTLPRWQAQAGE